MDAVEIGPEGIPEKTLGWTLLGWASYYLKQPDGPDAGGPIRFTREQAKFLLWWYAVNEQGQFVYRSGVFRRMKGHGKDPVGAALCLIELCGPTQFSHVDRDGEPVGAPHAAPWVQVAAVSREQTRNTFTLFPGMCSDELISDYGLEVNKEIIHKRGGGRVEAVTSSPKALEGGRSHFVLMNETQFWLANNSGHEMENAIAGNVAKGRSGSARRLAICNAHVPGEDSVGERDYDLWQEINAGKSKTSGFLYDSRETPPEANLYDRESLREGLIAARGDSTWLDVDRLLDEIYDPRTPVSEARRKYLNQVVAAEDAWISAQEWDVCQSSDKLSPKEEITLGFDGSKSNDSTALVACRVSDALIVPLAVWEHPDHDPDWEVPGDQVSGWVDWAMSTYKVIAFWSDVYPWESYVDRWTVDHSKKLKIKAGPKSPIGFDMRFKVKEFTLAAENFWDSVQEQALSHNGDPTLRRHLLNARKHPNKFGTSIGKEHRESNRKIDTAVSAILAYAARQELVKTKRVGKRKVIFK